MKKISLVIASVALCSGVFAQKSNVVMANEKFTETIDSTVVVGEGSGLLINKFWDGWFISANAGGQVYFGDNDGHKSLFNRITPNFDLAAGKWFTPILGLRGQLGYSPNMIGYTLDGANKYATGTPDGDGYFEQKWSHIYFNANVMLNLSNVIGGYRTDRFYNIIPYAGAGAAFVTAPDTKEKDKQIIPNIGIINNFRLSNTFDINVELKGIYTGGNYDNEKSGGIGDGIVATTIGLTWKIGGAKRHDFKSVSNTKTYITRNYKPEVQIVKEVVVEEKIVKVADGVKAAPMTMFFDFGQAKVTPRAKVTLEYAAEMIKGSEGKFRVTGMADSKTGSAKVNQKLSEQRAQAVRDVLVNQYGVPADKLIVEGIGGVDYKSPFYVNRAVVIAPEKK